MYLSKHRLNDCIDSFKAKINCHNANYNPDAKEDVENKIILIQERKGQ